MRLAPIIEQFKDEFLSSYQNTTLPSHTKALDAMMRCRTEQSPLMRLDCNGCGYHQYIPHSCGHRNCPHCQHHESQQWIERQLQKQVPTRYALITFTIPKEYRPLAWSYQRLFYALMFKAVWDTLKTFSKNDKQLRGTPGVIAVLHTNTRALDYHPHIHVIMPMGAMDVKHRLWRIKKCEYLFHHKALAEVFRAKVLEGIQQDDIMILPKKYPKEWIVDCRTVGKGKGAITYLGRYLYRGVIQEKDILSVKDGKVTFRYIDGDTKEVRTRTVTGAKFLWLLVQHVLPRRFRRSRNYGFLHPNSKRLLQLLYLILRINIPPIKTRESPTMKCPCCNEKMQISRTRLPPNPVFLLAQGVPI